MCSAVLVICHPVKHNDNNENPTDRWHSHTVAFPITHNSRDTSQETEGRTVQEDDMGTGSVGVSSGPRRGPLHDYTTSKAFLVLWRQLQGFKEDWGRRQLSVERIDTTSLYGKYSSLYRSDLIAQRWCSPLIHCQKSLATHLQIMSYKINRHVGGGVYLSGLPGTE